VEQLEMVGVVGSINYLKMFLFQVAYPRGYGSLAFDAQDAVERCMAVGTVHNVNGHPVEIKVCYSSV
jgi:hypothetical protein